MNILDLLTNKQKNELIIRHFSKGDALFKEGEECLKIGIVLSGEVKISTFSPSGKEIVFNTLKPNEIFGNNLIFSSSPFYKGYVLATKNSELAFIDKEQLIRLLKTNDEFLCAYLNIQSDFGTSERLLIELLSISSAKERLLFFLKQNNGRFKYDSISSLAASLSLSREALSRTISNLIKKKILIREDKILIIRN